MRLRTLLGDHPCTAALKDGSVKSDLVAFDFADYSPTNTGFKPMAGEQAFISKIAIVKQGKLKPADLNGTRVGMVIRFAVVRQLALI